jgi:hypothetical protein
MRSIRPLIACLIAWHPVPLAGQQEQAELLDRTAWSAHSQQAPVRSLAASGVLGGAAGWILGTVAIGIPLAHALPATDDNLSTPGLIIGFELGQALGIASGVHLANGRRGDFRKSLYLSAAAAALGTALLWTDDFDAVFETPRSQVILIAVPLVQLTSSIYSARAEESDSSPPSSR